MAVVQVIATIIVHLHDIVEVHRLVVDDSLVEAEVVEVDEDDGN